MLENYRTLELPMGASKTQVKEAFHRLAKVHHPDKGGDLKKMQSITAAYTSLMKVAPDTPRVSTGGTGGSGSFSYRSSTGFSVHEVRVNGVKIDPKFWSFTMEEAIRRQKQQEDIQRQREEIERQMARARANVEDLKRYYHQRFGGI